jgi:hypothetical protein
MGRRGERSPVSPGASCRIAVNDLLVCFGRLLRTTDRHFGRVWLARHFGVKHRRDHSLFQLAFDFGLGITREFHVLRGRSEHDGGVGRVHDRTDGAIRFVGFVGGGRRDRQGETRSGNKNEYCLNVRHVAITRGSNAQDKRNDLL